MAAQNLKDLYGTNGGTPDKVAVNGTGAGMENARSNPEEFGAGVAEAASGLGQEGVEIGNKYMGLAAEAKVNDDYANKYVPQAIALRNQYDMLDSKDKVAGYQAYVGGLQDLNKQFTAGQPSFYGQKLMSSQINRHIEGETEGANRELVASQIRYEAESKVALMNSNNNLAASQYSNHDYAADLSDQNDAILTMHHADNSIATGNPIDQTSLSESQRLQRGSMSVARTQAAINAGDVGAAYTILKDNSDAIPAPQQLHLDNVLTQQSMTNAGTNGVKYIAAGQTIPDAHGYPPYQVQATVADAAHAAGVDPNDALTVAKIESNWGQNTGTRGDIGQTGKGGTIDEQAQNMVTSLKSAGQAATSALGRQAEPWEQYICYQQGNTGGSALLKAATDNPNASAISVISPFYKNSKDAMDAITHNGGTATMTSGDFLDFIKQKYNNNAALAQSSLPSDQVGQAIRDAHTSTIPAVQQGSMTPKQQLEDFNKRSDDMLAQINAYPIGARRDAMLEAFNRLHSQYEGASNRYTQQLVDDVQKKIDDPKFNINQLQPDQMAELAVNHPQTLTEMRARSEANQKYGFEQAAKITDVNSKNFNDNLKRVLATDSPNQIRDETQLHGLLGRRDETGINLKDYRDLNTAINLPEDFKTTLAKKVNAVETANGNIDNKGGERSAQLYFQAVKLYQANDTKQAGKLSPLELDKQIDALMEQHTPSRIDQISNLAKAIPQQATATAAENAKINALTVPAGQEYNGWTYLGGPRTDPKSWKQQ